MRKLLFNLLGTAPSLSLLTHNSTLNGSQLWYKWSFQISQTSRIPSNHKSRYKIFTGVLVTIFIYFWVQYAGHTRAIPQRTNPIYFNSTAHLPHIPPYIWQLYLNFSAEQMEPEQGRPYQNSIYSWISRSPSYAYTLLDSNAANTLMARLSVSSDPGLRSLVLIFDSFRTRWVMAGDFLRYLLLALEGGVYSDMDTSLLKPIRDWVPEKFKSQTRAVVGIEFDQRGGGWGMSYEVQFCQWTIASSPGHPLLWAMVSRIAANVVTLARLRHTSLWKLEFSDRDVLDITGPAAWTAEVYKALSDSVGEAVYWHNVTGLIEPRLFGDVLVLPINAFGTGQAHSGSARDGSEDALVRHHFGGSWRKDNTE